METQQATIVPDGAGFRCSACQGGVRKDATSCKHCGRTFVAAPAEPPQFCPSCGKPAVGDAQFCASCGKPLTAAAAVPVQAAPAAAPAPAKKSGSAAGILIAIIVLIAGLFALSFAFGGRSGGGGTSSRVDTVSAYVMCKQFVTDRLKSPSTATFPSMADSGVRVAQLDRTKFTVSAFVDSQNGFGAMIRTRFDCTVHNTGGDNWQLDNLTTTP